MKEQVTFAVTGMAFGVGLAVLLQASNFWEIVSGLLIIGIGLVILK